MSNYDSYISQSKSLRNVPWDLLVIMDACRADYFERVCPAFQRVRTPARNTPAWFARTARIFRRRKATYFTANPMIDQENEQRGHGVHTVSLWERYWGRWGEYEMPTVHPASAVAAYLSMADQYPKPHVLHLMQPHAPFIGSVGLNAVCGPHTTAVYGLDPLLVKDAVQAKVLTWETIRAAYAANVVLVWQAVRALLDQFEGLAVVTSDHGELLGEHDGLFGHRQIRIYKCEETLIVPWVEVHCKPVLPDRVARLAALGYI